jgi:hypothetical protein
MATTPDTVRILSSILTFQVADFPINDPALVDYTETNPLVMGEWLTRNTSGKLLRAANPGVPPGPWMYWAETGRGDIQGMASKKVPVILRGGFLAETKVFNALAPPALGAALEVANITYDGLTKSGLQTHAAGANPLIGYVTKRAADNNGWLEFQECLY